MMARRAVPLLRASPLLVLFVVDQPEAAATTGLRPHFIANEGQVAAEVAYYAPSAAGTLFVTRQGEDLYVGALLPDGVTIVCWTVDGGVAVGRVTDLRSLRSYAARMLLPSTFTLDRPDFASYQWTGTEPRGRYVFFVFAGRVGALDDGVLTAAEILTLATTTFTFP